MYITPNVNAERCGADGEPLVHSLDVLREHLDLAASKNGRDQRTYGGRSHPPARLAALHGRERLR
jgi:aerobic-type carbon monoxide dehydrogenase small subunit (CoxS/CutS family)